MTEALERLVNRMTEEGQKTVQFFEKLLPTQWERTVYSEGAQWTVRQVLAHFIVTEAGIRALMQNILAGGSGAPQDFDLNRYNERKAAELSDIAAEELLARFSSERRTTIEWLRGLSADDLVKTGRHPWLGVAPLDEMIQLMYRHTQIHQRDIRKLLAEG
jgi:hypothetical protein